VPSLSAPHGLPPLGHRQWPSGAMSDSLTVLFVVLAALVALAGAMWGLVILVGRGRQSADVDRGDAVEVLQSQVETVRREGLARQDAPLKAVRAEIGLFNARVGERLAHLQTSVTTELREVTAEVNRRLLDGMALMQDAQKTMGQRLDDASRAVTEVHSQLGAL